MIPGIGEIGYIGLTAFVLNVGVAVVLTLVLRALKAPAGVDETAPADYTAESAPALPAPTAPGDPGLSPDLPEPAGA